ncbi:AAA family ATPase [Nonomuraea phyllanthi]|uniref:AAA family ATPase n=1 Tax=Nonomuraea phyllanthi TaxID=2219224 RepID=A0A5C4WNK1_9ACTN|nr:AAA family ATPase [Nonomuraea phyllanthi]
MGTEYDDSAGSCWPLVLARHVRKALDQLHDPRYVVRVLHGRAIEQSAVGRLLAEARTGASAALVVRGEIGIGKTALLDHAGARAASLGMRVLRCTGVESETELPFAALHLLLRPHLPLADALPEPQAAALHGAFGLTRESAGDRFLVGMAALTMMSQLTRGGPLLCLVDDAHRLDRASGDALLFAARRLDAEGAVMLFAADDGFALGVLPELRLTRLADPDAAAVVESVTGRRPVPSVLDRLLGEAEGNPLALRELAAALTPEQRSGSLPALPLGVNGTPTVSRVQQVFRTRIERLPPRTRALLLVAAADNTGLVHVVRAAAAAFDAALGDLSPAEEASLVRVSGASIAFCHPLVRVAAYQGASAIDRMAAHRALAGALRGTTHADRRAWHRATAMAGPDERTARDLDAVARREKARQGHAAAASAYERAAELSATRRAAATRLTAAARAAFDAGQLTQATRLADQALDLREDPLRRPPSATPSQHSPPDLWGPTTLPPGALGGAAADAPAAHANAGFPWGRAGAHDDWEADAVRLRAAVAFEESSPVQGSRILVESATLRSSDAPASAAVMLVEAARAAWYTGDAELAARIAHDLRDLHGQSTTTALLADTLLSFAGFLRGEPAPGIPRIRALIESARHSPPTDPRLALLLASAGLSTADHRGSYELADALVADCRARGLLGSLPGALLVLARSRMFLGHHREAEATAVEGLRLARETGQRHTADHFTCLLAWLAAVSGDPSYHRAPAPPSDTVGADLANWARGLADLASGRYASALEHLTAGKPHASLIATYLAAPDEVEAAVRCARPDRAAAAFHRFDAWAAQTGRATPEAIAHRCRALLLPPGSRDDDRQAHFEAAMYAHRLDPQPYEQARTELLYGGWLRRTRRKRAARELLHAARERFAHLGARPWARRAAAELRATGDPAPTGTEKHTPYDLLTTQERQVARLASRGVSNRDIAAQLFLSPRTVGNHLYRAFRKLGITSRHDLGALLGHDAP